MTKNLLVYKAANDEVPHKLWSIRMVILATCEFLSQCTSQKKKGQRETKLMHKCRTGFNFSTEVPKTSQTEYNGLVISRNFPEFDHLLKS